MIMEKVFQLTLIFYSIVITIVYLRISLNYPITEPVIEERIKPKKYVTFDRYGGRMNNQLFQMAAAAAAAKTLGRTLILPVEKRIVDWVGIYDDAGIWDLSELEEKFDIIRVHEYSREPLKIPKECKIDIRHIFKNKLLGNECEIISLGGGTRQLYCKKQKFCGTAEEQRMAYTFYQSLRVGRRLQKIIDDYPVYELGLHSRSFLGSGNKEMCPSKSLSVLSNHLFLIDDKLKKMVNLICTTREGENFKELAGFYNKTVDKNMVYAIDYPEFSVAGGHKFERFKTNESNLGIAFWGYNPRVKDIENIVQIILEQRILAKSKFFFGNVFSTLSFTICILRGEEKRWSSNVCGLLMHPEENKIKKEDYWNSVVYKN